MGDRTTGGIYAGHSDVSFAIGDGGAVRKDVGFTMSGAGAILPLNLSGLNQERLGELASAIEFQKALKTCNFRSLRKSEMSRSDWIRLVSSGKWDKFLSRGLIAEDIWEAATTGIIEYLNLMRRDFYRIGTDCQKHRIQSLPIGGGSGQMIGLLFGPILKEFVAIKGTKDIEDKIAAVFPTLDLISRTRLVDLFQVASGMDVFLDYFENGPSTITVNSSEVLP